MAKRLQLTKNVTTIRFDNEVTAEYFDLQDFIKVINMTSYAGLRDYVIIFLMLSVGTRINETVNIRVKDVNLKDKYIIINGECILYIIFRPYHN